MLLSFFSFITVLFAVFSMASFSAHNAVYFMILSFLTTGFIYYIIGSTYVSMILFIVYVGAVAMLFVFCVMLLNLKNTLQSDSLRYYLYYPLICLIIFSMAYFYTVFYQPTIDWITFYDFPNFNYQNTTKDHTFLSTFYTVNLFYITILGFLLFFVTVAVTFLLS